MVGRLGPLEAVGLEQVSVWRSTAQGRTDLLREIDWRVGQREHWVVLGPNGAGKTTLIRIASARARPSHGVARVLGRQLGRFPLAQLRREIGVVEPMLARRFYPDQRAVDVVMTGHGGTILLVEEADESSARDALAVVGAAELAERLFVTCSEGERARILLARALVADAKLLILDEPTAGLDLPGRLLLLHALEEALSARPELTTITVTHELEALPPRTTHALLLRQGAIVGSGPIEETLSARSVAECFDLPLEVAERVGS
jgi:iron complex transport system ATP-binding protein